MGILFLFSNQFYVCSCYTYWSAILLSSNLFCLDKYTFTKENCENTACHYVANHKHFKISKSNHHQFFICLLCFGFPKDRVSLCPVAVLDLSMNRLSLNSQRPTSVPWVVKLKACATNWYLEHFNLRKHIEKEDHQDSQTDKPWPRRKDIRTHLIPEAVSVLSLVDSLLEVPLWCFLSLTVTYTFLLHSAQEKAGRCFILTILDLLRSVFRKHYLLRKALCLLPRLNASLVNVFEWVGCK